MATPFFLVAASMLCHLSLAQQVVDSNSAEPGTHSAQSLSYKTIYSEVIKGLPVRFTKEQDVGPGMIFTGTPLDIEFVYRLGRVGSTKWMVVVDDFPKPWVGVGGAQDHPGKQIIDGTFNIQRYGIGYKLVFCPIATAPPGLCCDIGRYDDKFGRHLLLTENDPYEVVFEDADANGRSAV